MTPSVYMKMIAGSFPAHTHGPVDTSLRLLAQNALGSDQIHFVRSDEPNQSVVHYFAVPSAALASVAEAELSLACALPGHPQHRGPGVYVQHLAEVTAAAVFDGRQLDFICNDPSLMADFLAEQTLPVHSVTEEVTPWLLKSVYMRQSEEVTRLSAAVLKQASVGLVAAIFLYAAAAMAESWFVSKSSHQQELTAASLQAAIKSVQAGSQLSRQLAEYQAISAVAVRAGGWIDSYSLKDKETKPSFRVFLPAWVTPDYVAALGDGVSAQRDSKDEQLLVFTKGKPEGDNISSDQTVARPGEQAAEADVKPQGPQGANPVPAQ